MDVLGVERVLTLPEAWGWELRTERVPGGQGQCRARNWLPGTSKLGYT